MNLSNEDAIKLAEWLDWEESADLTDGETILHHHETKEAHSVSQFIEWLQIAEAERAIMDKLGETRQLDRLISIQDQDGSWVFKIEDWYRDVDSKDYEGKGSTRIEALINAVLEILKDA